MSNIIRQRVLTPGFRLPEKRAAHCHVMIAEVAKGLANVLFEEMMGKNEIYTLFKTQYEGTTEELRARFVAHLWPQLIESARATLAAMLRGPYPEDYKEQILDALVRDKTLMNGKVRKRHLVGNVGGMRK